MKYRVTMVRTHISTVMVEVEADNADQAADKAVDDAENGRPLLLGNVAVDFEWEDTEIEVPDEPELVPIGPSTTPEVMP